jgi:eukaryotic-like serine/threonine-protein kinase
LANGAGQDELLLKNEDNKVPNDWSRDGRYVLYARQAPSPGSRSELWVLPVAGTAADRKPSPFLEAAFNVASGQFSPDSRWIAYASDESGRPEIYVQPFPASAAGGKWLVSSGGGTQPHWRRDGKELLYIAPDGKLMAAEVSTDTAFHPGVPRPLFDTRLVTSTTNVGIADVFWWDVSPDGKKFLVEMASEENTSSPITVVLNWQAGLKK